MKRFIVLVLVTILAVLYIRHEAIEFGKKSYKFGCEEAALKLERLGDLAGSQELYKFCDARSDVMDKELDLL